jgi:ribonuclease P protein component
MGGKLEMIRSPRDFRAIGASSRSRVHPLVVVRYRRNDLDRTRFGISTGRRLGTAVARNRVRRRLKASLQVLADGIGGGWDILLVARPAAAAATQSELAAAAEQVLRAGGLMEGTGSSK